MYPIAPANKSIINDPDIAGVKGAAASNMQTNENITAQSIIILNITSSMVFNS
ncbi:hypothetical protein PTE01_02300 [Pseudoalteromonas tetraodonis GFC]|uniref:Uncharacterized protein n=1 Tax=Pseudoalteromonas tetraodonis GFC TaxID=1315271 RepID=A0AA37W4D0_9GAMM|nr:hypothetical protein PSM_A1565 [Pseudoalteromonas sp. SM9913]ATD03216.1 hypothetical protein PTET_a1820 [Pseudoalteromonas tetraodonis]GEN37120.1 hypothetical protein PTE01_02300 [Pseudoalteromonas tetraodonis GFC]GLQ02991.1 hypothetical protein GCM10007914_18720 [Pseudoalteromonas tetraodonis GFC]